MRAWAALGVMLIHSGGAGLRDLGVFGNRIADFGSSGVYAFFVISDFCVCYSYLNAKNYRAYILKIRVTKKGLSNSIILAVTSATHAGFQIVLATET